MRECGGILLLALAILVAGWGLWKLYGPHRHRHGIRIRLPKDDG
jgi:hypothetical protein